MQTRLYDFTFCPFSSEYRSCGRKRKPSEKEAAWVESLWQQREQGQDSIMRSIGAPAARLSPGSPGARRGVWFSRSLEVLHSMLPFRARVLLTICSDLCPWFENRVSSWYIRFICSGCSTVGKGIMLTFFKTKLNGEFPLWCRGVNGVSPALGLRFNPRPGTVGKVSANGPSWCIGCSCSSDLIPGWGTPYAEG